MKPTLLSALLLSGMWIGLVISADGQNATSPETISAADLARLLLGKAADKPPQACAQQLHNEFSTVPPTGAADQLSNSLDAGRSPLCAAFLILSSKQFAAANSAAGGQLVKAAEAKFTLPEAVKLLKAISQQKGTGTGSGGSTNLTSKGMASKLLSIASEYGALTESTSNNTTTVQGTFAGVPLALMQHGAAAECSLRIFALTPCVHQGLLNWLNRTSYSVSFATLASSAATTTASTSTTAAQVSNVTPTSGGVNAYSFKAILIQGKLDTSKYSDADKQVQGNGSVIDAAQTAQGQLIDTEAAQGSTFLQFLGKAADLRKTGEQHGEKAMVSQWRGLADDLVEALGVPKNVTPQDALKSPVLLSAVNLALAYSEYLGSEDAAYLSAMTTVTPVLSFEFDESPSVSAPSNSLFRIILQKSFKPLTLTVNGAVSIYNSPQPNVPGAGRLRDSQFATELSHPFTVTLPGGVSTNLTLSGAFYDQYQSSPAILNVTPGAPVNGVTFVGLPSTATQVYGTTGNIAIGQLKLTTGGGSALTVPLSVTYSNRTELIANPTWKAQIGVSYDFDSLFSSK